MTTAAADLLSTYKNERAPLFSSSAFNEGAAECYDGVPSREKYSASSSNIAITVLEIIPLENSVFNINHKNLIQDQSTNIRSSVIQSLTLALWS
ncbi:MAG: hypothetical protein ACK56F_21450 [bacterium]